MEETSSSSQVLMRSIDKPFCKMYSADFILNLIYTG